MADCFPSPTNIVSWWPGDGAANDVAGGNNGVLQGGATAGAAGMVANAFSFDGTNGYVQIPDSPALKPTNLTVEAWVRFTGLDSAGNAGPGQQYIVFKQNTRNGDFEGFALSKSRLTGGDVFNFAVTSASGQAVDVSSTTLVTTGVWYHVAGVRGSNFLQIYVNGQLQRQTNVSFAQDYGSLPLFFGSSGQSFWDGKLKGNLDEVTLYNRALASNEIAAVFAAGAAGKCKSVNISTQPVSQTVIIGSNVAFSVAATGFGSLGYRWQFNGTNISGATNPNLILTNIQATNAGNYAAVVTNSLSSATSAVAVLTVNVPPAITVLPMSQTTNQGAAVSFSVTASGTAPLNYQWRKAGVLLNGQTSNVLTFSVVTTNDAGSYDVVVSNVAGSVTSSPPALLTVTVPPVITVLPVSQTTNEGAALSFSVTAIGTAPLNYQWRKTGAPLNGQTSNMLAFSVVTTNDAGSYDVVVNNVAGSATSSPPALLTVNVPPVITVLPANQTTNEGAAVSFSVTATGTAPLSYQWRKVGVPLNGQTSNMLAFAVVTTNDTGSYDVVVSNVAGSVTSTPPATLTVYELNIPPVIVVSPQNQATNQGSPVIFNVTAIGTAPLSYQWRKEGTPMGGETSNVLAFSVVTANDAGNYDVVVTNTLGSVTSSPPATLTVNVPPLITVLPVSQTTNEGAAVSFNVTATGTAPLSYQWLKAGVPLNGQTSNVLAIAVVTTNDAGSYDVVVSNMAGSVTSSPPALLTVNVPPVITVLPTSQTTSAGAAVNFSVTAVGTAPLSYQWRKTGVPLIGQTSNVLAFSVVTTNDTGIYDAVVSNVAGSVTSSPPALLTVIVPPTNSMHADALVIVNSASARYLDFRNNIQPYLDNFGVPYSVIDIKTNAATTNITQHALIIIGHRQLDTNHVYFDSTAQNNLSLAVSNGTGLVNFDYALSGSGVSSNYTFVQDIFGFTYSSNSISSSAITFPATEVSNQLHYVTALHSTTDSISIRSNLVLAGVTFPTNVNALALRGTNPLVMVTSHGKGRAVQWGGYNWMTMAVKGPMAGLDDLVWRSFVWAARKPFVLRGMPNHVVLRVDDVAGPTAAASSSAALTNWVRIATETGFKPHLELFYNCLDQGEISVIRNAVTNGQATASIHSQGCGGGSFFYFDHLGKKGWPDDVMAQNFAGGTQWLQASGIPHARTMCPHYSEVGTNIFAGLKAWGVEFTSIEIIPGQVEYTTPGAPWLVAGPYRLYETPLEGQSVYPFFYADFLPIPNHPELNGQFFNCYTEIRDDSACAEWCPDNNVTNSVAMGVRQLKRGFDSMAMATLFTHDYFFYPTADNGSMAGTGPITTNNWRAILQGITNGIAGYNPQYVTIDYANQYVRATRTAQLTNAVYDPVSGDVELGLSGRSDLQLQIQVFVGEGNAISNRPAVVPAFTNNITVSARAVDLPPTITLQPQDTTVVAGTNLTLAVGATGTSPLIYQWRFNGTNILEATNVLLQIVEAQPTNEGMYEVVVSNLLGVAISSSASVQVLLPPSFTSQPQSQTVSAGTSLVLEVSVTGSEPITYQWQHEGTNAPGATNAIFPLSNAMPAAAGLYSVQATNAAGFAVSSNALLTVLLPETYLYGLIHTDLFAISFNTIPGGNYSVEYTTNLPAISWLTLSNLSATETNATVFDTLNDARRFYRVIGR